MAVVDFPAVWSKTVGYVNKRWKGAGLKDNVFVDEQSMESVVKKFLNDLEAAFSYEYESRFSPTPYPFAGLISESRIDCQKTKNGYDYIISFGGNDGELNRCSLLLTRTGARTGRGVNNIISLFDKGYGQTKAKWGLWQSKSRGKDIHTKSRNYLDGLAVISDFVDDFTTKHRRMGIVAMIIAAPEYYAR